MNKKTQNGFAPIILLIIVLVAAAGIGGTFYVTQKKEASQNQEASQKSKVTLPASSATKTKTTTEWQVFESELGYSIEYPVGWEIGYDLLPPKTYTPPFFYDPALAGSGIVDGEELGFGTEVLFKVAGFGIVVVPKDKTKNDIVNFNIDTFKDDLQREYSISSLKPVGSIEDMIVGGYPAAKIIQTEPLQERTIVWQDGRHFYTITITSFDEGRKDALERLDPIIDHAVASFQGVK